MHRTTTLLAAAGTTLALAAAGCGGSGSDSGGGPGDPIKLGAISSLTGQLQFPETTAAAKAVFDRVNAAGGVDGRKIEYVVEDDKAQPAVASQAARRLVDQEGVVALVGGTSLASCAVNGAYLTKSKVLAVEGAGVLPQCFTSPNIAPVNTGPFAGYTSLLYFASQELKAEKVCAIVLSVPGLNDGYLAAAKRWETITGRKLAALDNSVGVSDDPTPAVLKMKQAGCDAVAFNANEPQVAPMLKAAEQQGVLDGVDWITLTSGYTAGAGKALAKQGTTGLYSNSEYEPYTSDSAVLDDWRALMAKAKVPLSSFAEGGYLSATILVDTLKGIDGDITRESVTKALHATTDYRSDLVGSPFSFAPAKAHNPNQASKIVQVAEDGTWKTVSKDWLRLPQAG
jgi:branched-chain amino acid transport system substrate-binding protein